MTFSTPVVWSPATRRHEPRHEVWVGVPTVGTEVPGRVDAILAAMGEREPLAAHPYDDEILRRVHDRDLLAYLRGAHQAWMTGPYAEVVGQDRVVPYFFPTHALAQGMPLHRPAAAHALAGGYCYDTMTLVGPGTWEAARAAVDVALTAVDLVAGTGRSAYALCRPPGPPRDPQRLRRLLLPQQRGRRGRGAARRRATAGSASSTSTPTTATAPQAIFWDRAGRALRLAPRRPRRRLVPARGGLRRRDGAPARGRAGPATCRWLPAPATPRGPAAVIELTTWAARLGLHGAGGVPGRRRGRRRPREPAAGDARGLPHRRWRRSPPACGRR